MCLGTFSRVAYVTVNNISVIYIFPENNIYIW